ncbi:hypothetical protein BOO86_15970 [Mycobacterium sp. CBMA 234]|uniref:hypothetical protein n=1 Tax=Mycolicibacterium sp. CBMA 234 TaxID=1918495 RepID=UPI0012DC0267|nr:hypothetical protein [Mycolicibacterium sp. CBMA 234]MUL65974.1 hypothetical protein [Mycolicibacterium sp. CBMA 234]
MLLVVLVLAAASWVLVTIGSVTQMHWLAWAGIGLAVVGLVVLLVDKLRNRGSRSESVDDDAVQIGKHFPDYDASAHPAHDAMVHDDHEVEREMWKEEDFVHHDDGPSDLDISGFRAADTIGDTHFRADRDRGGRH